MRAPARNAYGSIDEALVGAGGATSATLAAVILPTLDVLSASHSGVVASGVERRRMAICRPPLGTLGTLGTPLVKRQCTAQA